MTLTLETTPPFPKVAIISASLKVLDVSRNHFKVNFYVSTLSCPNLRRLICRSGHLDYGASFGCGVYWDQTAETQAARAAREALQSDPVNENTAVPVAGQTFLNGYPGPGRRRGIHEDFTPSAVAMDVHADCVIEFVPL